MALNVRVLLTLICVASAAYGKPRVIEPAPVKGKYKLIKENWVSSINENK